MIGPARWSQGARLITYASYSNTSEGLTALVSFCKLVIDQRFRFFISSSIYSDERHARAMIVSVGFLCVPEAKAEASITKRFFKSQLCLNWLRTDIFGSPPMCAVPIS